VLARPLDPGSLDVAIDHFLHFVRVKWLADVIIRAEAQSFFGCVERSETSEHDHGEIRIDFADLAQTFDAVYARHANIHHDSIGLSFFEQLNTRFDAISGVHLVIRLQEHAQALAGTDLIIDNKDLWWFARDGHRRQRQLTAMCRPRAGDRKEKHLSSHEEIAGQNVEMDSIGAQAAICE
jgi:hypothetical protein